MDMQRSVRVTALKKAAIVMNALAGSMIDGDTKKETQSLTWVISWAVKEIEAMDAEIEKLRGEHDNH